MEERWVISPREYCFSAHDLQMKERENVSKDWFQYYLQANDGFLTINSDDFTWKCVTKKWENEHLMV